MKKILSILFVCIIVLSGCGKDDGKTHISFQHSMIEQERVDVIQKIIDEFNEANPDIIVEQVPVSEDSYNEKIVTQGSAGQLPAVIQIGKDMAGTMEKNSYVDFEANNELITTVGEDKFYEGVLKLSKNEVGEDYSIVPLDSWVQGMWYNTKSFEDNGLEVPNNYQNIQTAAKKLNTEDKKGIILPTDESTFTQQVFSQFALANSANVVDSEGNITYDTPEMTESLESYNELVSYSERGSINIDQVKDGLLSNNTDMVMYSSYMFPALYEAGLQDDYSFTTLQDENGNDVAFGNPTGLTITSNLSDDERAAAIAFSNYLLEPEQTVRWNLMTVGGSLPVRPEIINSEEYQDDETIKAMSGLLPGFEKSLENMQSFGTVDDKNFSIFGVITDSNLIAKSINEITVHDENVKDTVKETQTEMERLEDE